MMNNMLNLNFENLIKETVIEALILNEYIKNIDEMNNVRDSFDKVIVVGKNIASSVNMLLASLKEENISDFLKLEIDIYKGIIENFKTNEKINVQDRVNCVQDLLKFVDKNYENLNEKERIDFLKSSNQLQEEIFNFNFNNVSKKHDLTVCNLVFSLLEKVNANEKKEVLNYLVKVGKFWSRFGPNELDRETQQFVEYLVKDKSTKLEVLSALTSSQVPEFKWDLENINSFYEIIKNEDKNCIELTFKIRRINSFINKSTRSAVYDSIDYLDILSNGEGSFLQIDNVDKNVIGFETYGNDLVEIQRKTVSISVKGEYQKNFLNVIDNVIKNSMEEFIGELDLSEDDETNLNRRLLFKLLNQNLRKEILKNDLSEDSKSIIKPKKI